MKVRILINLPGLGQITHL